MGLPTVAMGLLAVTMPPAQAAALLLIPSLVTNLWQLFTGPSFGGLFRRLWTMMAGVVIGTVAGAGLLTGAHTMVASAALGAALVLYALLGLAKAGFTTPARHEAWISPLVGRWNAAFPDGRNQRRPARRGFDDFPHHRPHGHPHLA
ncbi:sulfite exporter TauE/SafE family protein [Mesorhizobium australicum]|uniref:sulfite exporter TauE/SafE family protein n=1 Tax=Mesorhizobium australicum TaxID=536018 RepID=UPI00334D016E